MSSCSAQVTLSRLSWYSQSFIQCHLFSLLYRHTRWDGPLKLCQDVSHAYHFPRVLRFLKEPDKWINNSNRPELILSSKVIPCDFERLPSKQWVDVVSRMIEFYSATLEQRIMKMIIFSSYFNRVVSLPQNGFIEKITPFDSVICSIEVQDTWWNLLLSRTSSTLTTNSDINKWAEKHLDASNHCSNWLLQELPVCEIRNSRRKTIPNIR